MDLGVNEPAAGAIPRPVVFWLSPGTAAVPAALGTSRPKPIVICQTPDHWNRHAAGTSTVPGKS